MKIEQVAQFKTKIPYLNTWFSLTILSSSSIIPKYIKPKFDKLPSLLDKPVIVELTMKTTIKHIDRKQQLIGLGLFALGIIISIIPFYYEKFGTISTLVGIILGAIGFYSFNKENDVISFDTKSVTKENMGEACKFLINQNLEKSMKEKLEKIAKEHKINLKDLKSYD